MEKLPIRKTIRLRNYDYRSKGVYHVTICTRDRRHCFGIVLQGKMILNKLGVLADENVRLISQLYPEADVIDFVVMPNHVHILLGLGIGADANYGVPTVEHTLGQIIRAYKASVTRTHGNSIWQPRFYEHIIRNDQDLAETIAYIRNNPATWEKDDYFIPL